MHLEDYDRIRAAIAAGGFTPEIETRIALFLAATKAVNLPFLALGSLGPANSVAWQALNAQLFRETEALTLLLRVTRWSPDPTIYAASAQLTAPLYGELLQPGAGGASVGVEGVGLPAVALGHALLATVRLAPIVPAEALATSPFAMALLRIEQDNGRLLQTQIRLLRQGFGGVETGVREDLIARKVAVVEAVFARFLASLAGPRPAG